jgi:hypothetical protein
MWAAGTNERGDEPILRPVEPTACTPSASYRHAHFHETVGDNQPLVSQFRLTLLPVLSASTVVPSHISDAMPTPLDCHGLFHPVNGHGPALLCAPSRRKRRYNARLEGRRLEMLQPLMQPVQHFLAPVSMASLRAASRSARLVTPERGKCLLADAKVTTLCGLSPQVRSSSAISDFRLSALLCALLCASLHSPKEGRGSKRAQHSEPAGSASSRGPINA